MPRLSETKNTRMKYSRSNPSLPYRSLLILLLLILLPLAIPVFLSGALRHEVAVTLRNHLPTQLQEILWLARKNISDANSEKQLSPKELLEACEAHQYTSEIISLDPLVIYINDFTSSQEAEELINIGTPDFADSFISRSRGGTQRVSGRTSSSAPLPLSHPLVDCILRRARHFMGSMMHADEPFSTPQLVRYFPGQKYDLHTDFWPEHQVMPDGSGRLYNRVASFFVFLRDNCTDGYTYFPDVETSHAEVGSLASKEVLEGWFGGKVMRGERDEEEKGVMFKPIKGNAIFWVNVDEKGVGDRRSVHAGLPVGKGEKIGLNIWPRKFYGRVEGEGEEKGERKGWSGKWKE